MLGQLNRGNALAGIGKQVNRNEPFPNRQFAFAEHGARFDGEVLLAIRAAIPLAIFECINLGMPAMGAVFAIAETDVCVMSQAGRLITEMVCEVRQRLKVKFSVHSGIRLP